MSRRSPEEIRRELVEQAGEDEVDRAAATSGAQARKELAEAGFDLAAEHARAAALLRELGSSAPASGSIAAGGPLRAGGGRTRSRARWSAAAALVAAAAVVCAMYMHWRHRGAGTEDGPAPSAHPGAEPGGGGGPGTRPED